MISKIKNAKYIIFDFDGTLVDSMWIWEQLDLELLASYGKKPDEYVKKMVVTMNILESASFFVDYYKLDVSPERVADEIAIRAGEKYEKEVELKNGVTEMLSYYKSIGSKMCVATVSARSYVEKLMRHRNIEKYFDFMLTSEDVSTGKSSPEIYLKCAERFGVSPDKIVIFEDALHAVETAKKAGFIVCAVEDGAAKDNFLRIKETADYTINDFSEIN